MDGQENTHISVSKESSTSRPGRKTKPKNPRVYNKEDNQLLPFTDLKLPNSIFLDKGIDGMEMMPIKHKTYVMLDFPSLLQRIKDIVFSIHGKIPKTHMQGTIHQVFSFHVLILIRRLLCIARDSEQFIDLIDRIETLPKIGYQTITQLFDTFGLHTISPNLDVVPRVTRELIQRLLTVANHIFVNGDTSNYWTSNFSTVGWFCLYGNEASCCYALGRIQSEVGATSVNPNTEISSVRNGCRALIKHLDLDLSTYGSVTFDNFRQRISSYSNNHSLAADFLAQSSVVPLFDTGGFVSLSSSISSRVENMTFCNGLAHLSVIHSSTVGLRSQVCRLGDLNGLPFVMTSEQGCDKVSIFMSMILGMNNEPVSFKNDVTSFFNFSDPSRRVFDFRSGVCNYSLSSLRSSYTAHTLVKFQDNLL